MKIICTELVRSLLNVTPMRRTNKPKKLGVSVEVVRRLDDKELEGVVGGGAAFCSRQYSGCSSANLTQTCTNTCGGTTIH